MSFSMDFRQKARQQNFIYHSVFSVSFQTLQVRIRLIKHFARNIHGKKTFLSAPGSLTLEAALALSLFIFAVVCMILPMNILNTERKLQAALESVGEELSCYAYLQDVLEKGDAFFVPGANEFAISFCKYLSAQVAAGYARESVSGHVDSHMVAGLTMIRSSVLAQDEWLDLVMDYQIRMPFPVLGLKPITRTIRCRRRAWVGRAGKDDENSGADGAQEDTIVYIGKNSTRYHRNRGCHYLDNTLSGVAYEQVGDLRNDGGGKYYACRICGGGATHGSTVYLMPSGKSYHTTKACTAIIAYVRAVRLSEVEHLGGCSYCSK